MKSLYNKPIVGQSLPRTPHGAAGLSLIPRDDFMPDDYKDLANIDEAFPIGYGQTISQPSTVKIMLDLLQLKPGNKVLEIGYGSGWVTSMLSEIVGPKGKIHAYEIVLPIAKFGKNNIKKHFGFIPPNIKLYSSDYTKSFRKNIPYDKILCSAAFQTRPFDLFDALTEGGIFVFPTKDNDIQVIEKKNGKFIVNKIEGFVFVPVTH